MSLTVRGLQPPRIAAIGRPHCLFNCSVDPENFEISTPALRVRCSASELQVLIHLLRAPSWIRTNDLRIRRPLLYPLSYGGIRCTRNPEVWPDWGHTRNLYSYLRYARCCAIVSWARWDLNPQCIIVLEPKPSASRQFRHAPNTVSEAVRSITECGSLCFGQARVSTCLLRLPSQKEEPCPS